MITRAELKTTNFGLIEGNEYKIFSLKKRSQNHQMLSKGIYIGEGGSENEYLIFQSPKHKFKECFLKVDIISGEYFIKDLDRKIKMEVANG